MRRSIVDGLAVVAAVLVATLFGSLLGLETAWPLVIAVALGLVRGGDRLGRVLAATLGLGAGWVIYALQAGFLPDTDVATFLSWVVGLLIVVIAAALTSERMPMWAGVAGVAIYFGAYQPSFASDPTRFLDESPIALASTVLAVGIGFVLAYAADALAGRPVSDAAAEAEVAA